MHADLKNMRVEDSGYQGTYNLLRFGGLQQMEYDRVYNPLACKSEKLDLDKFEKPRNDMRQSNYIPETTFDRVMIHSTCVPNHVQFRRY